MRCEKLDRMNREVLTIGEQTWEFIAYRYRENEVGETSVHNMKRDYVLTTHASPLSIKRLENHNYCALCAVYAPRCSACPLQSCQEKGSVYDTLCIINREYINADTEDKQLEVNKKIQECIRKIIDAHKEAIERIERR